MPISNKISRFGFLPKSSGFSAKARMGGFALDGSSMLRGFDKLNWRMRRRARIGLTIAGIKLMNDTVGGLPTTPIRRPKPGQLTAYADGRLPGGLRGSGAVFVNGTKKASSAAFGISTFQPTIYGGTPIPIWSEEACIVFNSPYAAKQHEEFPIKTEPTAGRYFMSMKLYSNANEYIGIVALAIKL